MRSSVEALLAEAALIPEDLFGNRREWKCLAPAAVADALRAEVARRLVRLEYVEGAGVSRLHSIYYDSDAFGLYQRALASEQGSLKFRLRSYWPEAAPAHFFECKLGVVDGAVKKKNKLRFRLPPSGAAALLGAGPAGVEPGVKPKFWRKALALMEADRLRPRLTVSYDREAFESPDGRLRVTFDFDFRASAIQPDLSSRLGDAPGTLGGDVVIEIKHLDGLPGWLSSAVAAQGLPAEGSAFSKFKASVAMLFPEVKPLAPV